MEKLSGALDEMYAITPDLRRALQKIDEIVDWINKQEEQKKTFPLLGISIPPNDFKKTYEFSLDERQERKFRDWIKSHHKACNENLSKTFIFTPTGLGCITKVKCSCGVEVDLTFSEGW